LTVACAVCGAPPSSPPRYAIPEEPAAVQWEPPSQPPETLYTAHEERPFIPLLPAEDAASSAPLTAKAYFTMLFLLWIPLVNLVAAIFWACERGGNRNRRSLARAWLLWCGIGTALIAAAYFIISALLAAALGPEFTNLFDVIYNTLFVS